MSNPQEMKSGPGAPSAKTRTETADPAPTKEQDHEDSMPDSTATGTPVGGATVTDISVDAIHSRAIDVLLSGDPVARELFQWGFRVGESHTVDRIHARAAHITDEFLSYLAEDPEAIPGPIPPLENDWRAAA
jgi:hypothetical protein